MERALPGPEQPEVTVPRDAPETPFELSRPLLLRTAAMTLRRGAALLRPQLMVAAAVVLVGIVIDVVDAFVDPTVVRDAAFVPLEVGPVRTVAGLALLVLAASAAAWALTVTTLRATAIMLGRTPRTADLVRTAARRWRFLAGWVGLAVVVALAVVAALPFVSRHPIVLVAALLLLWPAPLLLVFPVAISHGVSWGPAWARTREVLQRPDYIGRMVRGDARLLVFATAAVGAAVSWAAHLGAGRLGPVLGPVLGAMVDLVVIAVVATAVAVGLVRAWMRSQVSVDGVAQATLPADGVAQATHPADETTQATLPMDGVLPAADDGRTLPTALGWVAVAALLLTPAVAPAVATWNPTPAPAIEVISKGVSAPQAAVVQEDGAIDLMGLGYNQGASCALDAGTCRRLRPREAVSGRWSFVAATADPNGGIALLADRRQRGAGPVELSIVTCTASTCGDDASDQAAVALGVGGISPELVAIDAVPGTYAALVPRIEAPDGGPRQRVVDLALCTDATCADRKVTELGPVGEGGRTALRLADDGTAYVLIADPTSERLSLLKVAPGMTTAVTVATVPLAGWKPRHDFLLDDEGPEAFLLELDRGRPVVLYTDPGTGGLRLLNCNDSACSAVTTADVDVPAEAALAPNFVIDSTGNPLIAANEPDRGITVYSCLDRLCARTSGRLVAESDPPYDVWHESDARVPYLYLDREERPFLLLRYPPDEGSADTLSDEHVLLRCTERRCGM